MKKPILLFILISFISCKQEFPKQYWQKGNLHTHSFGVMVMIFQK